MSFLVLALILLIWGDHDMSEERITPKYLTVSTLVKTVSPTNSWGGGLEWRHLRDMNIVRQLLITRWSLFWMKFQHYIYSDYRTTVVHWDTYIL